mgnify:CR=1 FL=1
MLNTNDILETIQMITDEHLDVRTVTMGISLLDCADADGRRACEKIYNKITSRAKDLVRTRTAEKPAKRSTARSPKKQRTLSKQPRTSQPPTACPS